MEKGSSNPIRSGWLILTVLITLVGLSISIRAAQVQRVLHASAPTTMTAKADLPSQVLADVTPPVFATTGNLPLPRVTLAEFPSEIFRERRPTTTLWYSVSVQHRPPPQHLA
jgi:hypothetical protein